MSVNATENASAIFFFQAEDGIRDGTVTGVQTCALPIFDDPRDLRQEAARLDGHLGTLGELAEEVDEPAHRADQVALVAAEGLPHDPRPVVLAGGPAEDRGHEPAVDAHRHLKPALTLGLVDGLGEAAELGEPPPELRALAEKLARERRLARARLFDERGAQRRRLGPREVGEEAAKDALRDEQLVVVTEARDEPPTGLELPVARRAELLEHLHDAQELLPVG